MESQRTSVLICLQCTHTHTYLLWLGIEFLAATLKLQIIRVINHIYLGCEFNILQGNAHTP